MSDWQYRYHRALLVGPKADKDGEEKETHRGYRFQAKTPPGSSTEWIFDEKEMAKLWSAALLAKVVVAKVTDLERLKGIVRGIPIVQGDPNWNCVRWVEHALAAIQADGKAVGTSILDWVTVRDAAKRYVEEKKAARRYAGNSGFNMYKAATYDLLDGREIVP